MNEMQIEPEGYYEKTLAIDQHFMCDNGLIVGLWQFRRKPDVPERYIRECSFG